MPAVRRPAFFDFFPSVFLLNDRFSRFISRWRLNLFGCKHSLFNCLNKLHISLISGLNINRYLLLHFLMFSCLLGFIDWAAPDALLLFCVVSLVEPINQWSIHSFSMLSNCLKNKKIKNGYNHQRRLVTDWCFSC